MASGQGNNRRLFGQRGLAALKWGDRRVKGCTGSSPAHACCLTAFFPPPLLGRTWETRSTRLCGRPRPPRPCGSPRSDGSRRRTWARGRQHPGVRGGGEAGRCLHPCRAQDHPAVTPTAAPDRLILHHNSAPGTSLPVVFAPERGGCTHPAPSQGQDLISPLLLPG